MSLLKEFISEARKTRVKSVGTNAEKNEAMNGQTQNPVAKNMNKFNRGGAMQAKTGEKASRARRDRNWKKDAKSEY